MEAETKGFEKYYKAIADIQSRFKLFNVIESETEQGEYWLREQGKANSLGWDLDHLYIIKHDHEVYSERKAHLEKVYFNATVVEISKALYQLYNDIKTLEKVNGYDEITVIDAECMFEYTFAKLQSDKVYCNYIYSEGIGTEFMQIRAEVKTFLYERLDEVLKSVKNEYEI